MLIRQIRPTLDVDIAEPGKHGLEILRDVRLGSGAPLSDDIGRTQRRDEILHPSCRLWRRRHF
eukprot:8139571-Pyramimonas_sp.AAC.1